jgi:hypothetical protein
MASSIQLLRSNNAQERPFPGNLLDGQPAINVNSQEPGLFFKTDNETIIKIGPAAITSDGNPPNAGAVGQPGNTIGELWLDKSLPVPVLKVYDGVQWVDAGSGGGGSPGIVTLQRWIKTASGGETSLSGPDNSAQILSYTPGLEEVFVNGTLLARGIDYFAVSGTSITSLISPLTAGDIVTVLGWTPFNVLDPIDGSNLIDGTVSNSKLAPGSVSSDKLSLSDNSLSGAVLLDNSVPASKIIGGGGGGGDASQVTYTPNYTNSVTRSVKEKLEDSVCITDFGAIGDDDINNANINRLAISRALATGKSVYVPSGRFYFNNSGSSNGFSISSENQARCGDGPT